MEKVWTERFSWYRLRGRLGTGYQRQNGRLSGMHKVSRGMKGTAAQDVGVARRRVARCLSKRISISSSTLGV